MRGRKKSRKGSRAESDRVELLEALMREHESALLRYATRLLNNRETAQDVVQNVFIKLHKGLGDGMTPTDKVRGWLYRVTHNEAIDTIRRESRFRAMQDRLTDATEDDVKCDEGEKRKAKVDQVMMHLGKLDDREKQVVLLRLDEGLSYKEIAEITDRSVGGVGNILHHAVKKLSTHLGVSRDAGMATTEKQFNG